MNSRKSIFRALMLASMALFLFSQSVLAENPKTTKVFLLGGQSNMVGFGSKASELPPLYNDPLPQVQIWDLKKNKWTSIPLINGTFRSTRQTICAFGPEVSFGHAIANSFPRSDIRLIKYAASGTALYNDWAPTKGQEYVGFVETVNAALADLNANTVKYEIAGILWLQGESDANEKRGQDYENNLSAFITNMRAEFKIPKMPFVIARVRNHYGKGAQAKMVRDAQESVAKKDGNVEWFDTDDCGPLVKGGHYSSNGLIEIGKRFAEKSK